jgi:hypothetical protein
VWAGTVGFRSSLEARLLAQRASPTVGVFSMGGVLEWAHAGGTFVDASGRPTRRLHAFGAKWAAMAPQTCEVVVFHSNCSFLRAVLRVPTVWLRGAFARTPPTSQGEKSD